MGSQENPSLIRQIILAIALWGAPRIRGESLKLRIDMAQSTVAKSLVRGRRPTACFACREDLLFCLLVFHVGLGGGGDGFDFRRFASRRASSA